MARREAEAATRGGQGAAGRLLLGAVGGFIAGVVFIAINSWFVSTQGRPALAPFKLISSIVLGRDALMEGTASVPVGMVVHSVLSILFGVVFALIAPLFRSNGTVALGGVVYGGLLYFVNFLVLGQTVFPQFMQQTNQPFEVAVHLVFGYLLALSFYSSGARREEPFLAI